MTGGCSPLAPLSELTVEFSAKAASVNVASCRVTNLSSLAFSSSFAHNSSFLFITRTGSHSHGRRAIVVLSQQLRSGSLPEISEDGSEVDRGFENDNGGAPRNRAWRRPQEEHWRKSENSSLLRTAYRRRSVDTGVQQPKDRLDLLREKQPSRLHNRFTVFERVTDPKTLFSSSSSTESGSYASESSVLRRESSSASPSGRNVGISAALKSSSTPSALDREPSSSSLNSPGDGKSTSQFTSKLQEILENFKKKDQFARRNDTAELELFQRNFRRGSSNRGRHDSDGPAHVDGNNDAYLSNHADVSSTPHESVNKEESGTKGGPPSFNLFSNAPPVPRDFSQRRNAFPGSTSPNVSNVFARRLSRSIGSRSSPSRSSIPGKRSKYSKPDPKAGQTKTDVWRSNRVTLSPKEHLESHDASELDDSDVDMPQDSLLHTDKKSLESGLFEWSDSDSENDAEDKSFMESVVPSLDDVLQSSCDDFSHSTADADANLSSEKHIEQMPPAKQFKHEAFVPFANQHISDLPFEVRFSYSETPNAPVIGYREPQFSPFGPTTMSRPWTGRAPLKPSKKKVPEFDSFNPPPKGKKGIKYVQDPGPYHKGEGPKLAKTREEILGEPLSNEEIVMLVDKCQHETRQLNLGRDGLTHNMLDLVHQHWKRRRVCRIKCKGVPTVDMDNVCFHLEDKTGGKIIYRTGGTVYLFRGRNYNYKDRPRIPLMLWKPHAPIYPKLIQAVPEGLTKEQTYMLRLLASKVEPLCKLNKNGVYLDLVKEVRNAFKVDDLVRIDCEGLNPSDYKKIGAKLRDLVPCVLLSFRREQILMWKGRGLNASSGLNPSFTEEKMETVSTDNNDDSEALEDSLSIGKGCSSQLSNNATKIMCDGEMPDQQCDDGNTSDVGVKLPYQEISKHDIGSEESPESKHLNDLENFDDDRVDTFDMSFEEDGAALEEKDEDLSMMMPTVSAGDKELHLMERETSTNEDSEVIIVKVDVLWEQALKSGIAMVVDETDLDADLVFEKATELAERAPSGPVYTQNMIRKLAPKKELHKADELNIHFGKLNQLRKKKQPKRKRPLPTIDVPAMGGLPVDQLARLLSPN